MRSDESSSESSEYSPRGRLPKPEGVSPPPPEDLLPVLDRLEPLSSRLYLSRAFARPSSVYLLFLLSEASSSFESFPRISEMIIIQIYSLDNFKINKNFTLANMNNECFGNLLPITVWKKFSTTYILREINLAY